MGLTPSLAFRIYDKIDDISFILADYSYSSDSSGSSDSGDKDCSDGSGDSGNSGDSNMTIFNEAAVLHLYMLDYGCV